MSSFMDDLDAIDETTVENGPTYPLAQWLNGDPKLAAASEVAHTGGVLLPVKYLGEDAKAAPGWTKTTITFANGKSEIVLAAQKAALAVVRLRFRWRSQQKGVITYLPRSGYVGGAGLRGNLQALCGLYGYAFPVAVTFTGRASQDFERMLVEFNLKVLATARRLSTDSTGPNDSQHPRLPRFAFYMKVGPGLHQKAGQVGAESVVTLPRLDLPEEVTTSYLSAAYVGRERLLELQALYHASEPWVRAWDRFPNETGAGARAADDADDGE